MPNHKIQTKTNNTQIMKANARCEWVSPIQEFQTKKGETMKKLEVKFSFADADDNFMHTTVSQLFGKRADAALRELHPGECYLIRFSLSTWRTASGHEFNEFDLRSVGRTDGAVIF